jgi:hypothetical protein
MQEQIEELLSAEAPTLARVEDTLTEGYAQALALEAERWRSNGPSGMSRARAAPTTETSCVRSVRGSPAPTASS